MSQVPQCVCMYEAEQGLPLTRLCFVPCQAQQAMMNERAKNNLDKLINNDNERTD